MNDIEKMIIKAECIIRDRLKDDSIIKGKSNLVINYNEKGKEEGLCVLYYSTQEDPYKIKSEAFEVEELKVNPTFEDFNIYITNRIKESLYMFIKKEFGNEVKMSTVKIHDFDKNGVYYSFLYKSETSDDTTREIRVVSLEMLLSVFNVM